MVSATCPLTGQACGKAGSVQRERDIPLRHREIPPRADSTYLTGIYPALAGTAFGPVHLYCIQITHFNSLKLYLLSVCAIVAAVSLLFALPILVLEPSVQFCSPCFALVSSESLWFALVSSSSLWFARLFRTGTAGFLIALLLVDLLPIATRGIVQNATACNFGHRVADH